MDNLAMSLTSEQTDKILQFQDLTGIDNMTVCRDVLQRHSWDLEVAVQDQLNIREGRPTVFASTESQPPTVFTDTVAQHVFISPPSAYRWGGGTFGYVVSLVFRLCFDTINSLLRLTLNIFWRRRPQRQVTDPVGDVMSFIKYFEERWGREGHPTFYQGSYSQALSDAKQELRFLLVYLHKDNDEECNNFCRNTLSSPGLAEYINRSMLFWACSVSSGEGQRVSQAFQENTYPFLGVICLREHRMTIVGRILGSLEPQVLLHKLQTICVANEASLVAARADRVERNFNQTLRRQQDEAYEASLRADQQKEQMKRAEADKAEAERRRQLEAEEDERRRKEELQQRKVDLLSRIPVEPAASDADTVCVVFKLPNGQRLERRFTSTTTLQDVFNFVFCHPASPDEFEIATNFPKRVLTCQGAGALTTLADAGLKKSQVLFVYDLEA
ncbi:FAS-associated factor 2-like [Nilaparvata lugens]|uniref:FAS-associated factor 2-like n=1 Tax=Nilaparvata lugens TaxID=108931 RepID=UPI00193D2B06|nr:FAS-associated factor 2-like [Nilaparvata lugens]